ncbi:MAG TPA: L,D-transpeptidase family protein [Edaphobacter sp.]|nr:L,D-transpeptidase family protein [Edaphobacter sp.]
MAQPNAFAHSNQMIVVTTPDWDAVQGHLQRYERSTSKQPWRAVGEPIAIVIGKHGLAWGSGVIATDKPGIRAASDPVKREGDGKSPAGIFTLGTAFGYASQPLQGMKLPYLELTPSIECVDDVNSKHYDRIVDRSAVTPDWNSSEHMRNTGESYRWGIVVDHNHIADGSAEMPTAGGGSCIFLHIWQDASHGTAGCTAMPQSDVEALLRWLDPARKPLLVQLPAAQYKQLERRWKLPPLPASMIR